MVDKKLNLTYHLLPCGCMICERGVPSTMHIHVINNVQFAQESVYSSVTGTDLRSSCGVAVDIIKTNSSAVVCEFPHNSSVIQYDRFCSEVEQIHPSRYGIGCAGQRRVVHMHD